MQFNLYHTEIICSKYNLNNGDKIDITVRLKDYNNKPVRNTDINLYLDDIKLTETPVKSDSDGQYIFKNLEINGMGFHKIGTDYESIQVSTMNPYPVGSIYMSMNNTSPAILFGGEWTQIHDTFLMACGGTYPLDTDADTAKHGEAVHTLTKNEMPKHAHTQQAHSHGTGSSTYNKFVATNKNAIQVGNTKRVTTSSNGGKYYYIVTETGGVEIGAYSPQGATAKNNEEGASQAHNNLPPYMAVYVWKRVA